ncbi:MAG: hypothetical protein GH148_00085 [Clostridia bacterium]|nr:hypothetical protein [Clostridia bacterium]
MYQPALFDLEDIFGKPLRRYELFFSVLDLSLLEKGTSVGRKPISRTAIFPTAFNPYAKALRYRYYHYGKSLHYLPYHCLSCCLFFLVYQRT